ESAASRLFLTAFGVHLVECPPSRASRTHKFAHNALPVFSRSNFPLWRGAPDMQETAKRQPAAGDSQNYPLRTAGALSQSVVQQWVASIDGAVRELSFAARVEDLSQKSRSPFPRRRRSA